jgi:hypothetical protein
LTIQIHLGDIQLNFTNCELSVTEDLAPRSRSLGLIWTAALAVTALGTWILYDALPGINWLIWTATAAACLLLFLRADRRGHDVVITVAAIATLIAGGAVITANPFIIFLMFLGVISFLALEMLLATNPSWSRISAGFAVPGPVVAFGHAIVESIRRVLEALHLVRSNRARSVVGGIAITLPVVVIFAMLLASADPIFAGWRDAIQDLLSSLPRIVFFFALLSMVLGAYGFTSKGDDSVNLSAAAPRELTSRWLGVTERLILIASVTALLWLFLIVQITYLFGNLPQITGSGMTFAEYARRGFAELSVVASASAVLILVSERYGRKDQREGLLRAITIALVIAVLFLLGSAFHRVSLYEEAYGFTTARLYAQAYMILVAIALFALVAELRGEIDTRRLFRRIAAVATAAFLMLIYWNHESWIAARNIERFATTGKLDVSYLVRDLSPSAVPVIVDQLATLPPATSAEIRDSLTVRYRNGRPRLDGKWYEWNLTRARARKALQRADIPFTPTPPDSAPVP